MRIKEIIALLIVKRILLVSIGGWIKRTVWRIWIPKVWRVTKVFHEPLTPLASPPAPPPQKKNLWSPFSYKLPVISSPTRTLLRQRYIGFAVPSFFFCFATGIQNVRKRRRPYRKSEAFDSVVRRRRLWTVTVRYSYLPVVFQWCAFLKIALIFARCDVRR